MDPSSNRRWLQAAALFGIAYAVVGVAFAAPANSAASDHVRIEWRLAAWLVSAAIFASHIGYEHSRLRTPPRALAGHVSLAVALGAFLLAGSAVIHNLRVGSGHVRSITLALVAWPLLAGIPALVVAFVAGSVVERMRRSVQPRRVDPRTPKS